MTLTASEPDSPIVGAPVLWSASTTDHGEAPVYRFQVRSPDGELRLLRDFGPGSHFTWSPMREGVFEFQVTVKESFASDETETASEIYVVGSRVTGSEAVVSPTTNPLVALYSAPPTTQLTMYVEHRRMDSDEPWSRTPRQTTTPGRSTNFLIAEMLPETTYLMRHVLTDGTTSDPVPFTTGALPSNVIFPTFTQQLGPEPGTDLSQDMVFHIGINPPADTINTIATDREGNVVWYYDSVNSGLFSYAPSLTPEGTILLLGDPLDAVGSTSTLREIDLAGNILRETNFRTVSAQLAELGLPSIENFHHDAQRLPNGHTAVMAVSPRFVDVEGTLTPYFGDMIIVLDENFQVEWAWDPFQWLDTSVLPTQGEGPEDWMHANAVAWSPADGNLIMSLRSLDWVIKINYANGTGDGRVLWRLGNDGDFTIESEDPSPWFTHQHDSRYINDNTIVVFDNGNTRRASDPTANSRGQVLVLDETKMTAKLVVNTDLGAYALAVGGAQGLSGGNFVFTNGISRQTIEVLPDGTISYIQEMNLAPGGQYRSYIYDDFYADKVEPVGSASRAFDLDGDLKTDLLVYDPETATWVIRYGAGRQEVRNFGAPGDIAIPGDYDGDGKTDLAVFRPESDLTPGTAHWFAILSGGGVINRAFGAAGDIAVPADYDGDGQTDLMVYRPDSDLIAGTAHWFGLLSGGAVINQAFGAARDVPIPADYDGDGLTDLAVHRPNSDLNPGYGQWFAALSSGGVINRVYGATSLLAVPGDYDGDGKADLAVLRRQSELMPGLAHWFASLSGGGNLSHAFGPISALPSPGLHDRNDTMDLAVFQPELAKATILGSDDELVDVVFEELEIKLSSRARLLGPRWLWLDVEGDQDA